MKIQTIEDIWNWIKAYQSINIREMNKTLLQMYKRDEVNESALLEYFDITQSEVYECMEEGMKEKEDVDFVQ